MRLSDAIALGRVTVLKPEAGYLRGCALGMAMNATGQSLEDFYGNPNYSDLELYWPWINAKGKIPCRCTARVLSTGRWMAVIMHMFDHHVMRAGDWTLDQLIDWVRSVEPAEPEPPSAHLEEARIDELQAYCGVNDCEEE